MSKHTLNNLTIYWTRELLRKVWRYQRCNQKL